MQRLLLHARPTWMLWSGLLVLLIVAIGTAVWSEEIQCRHQQSLRLHSFLHAVDGVQIALVLMVSSQRNYLLTREAPYLDDYEERRVALTAALDDLAQFDSAATGPPPPGSVRPDSTIFALVADRVADLDKILVISRDIGPDAAALALQSDIQRKIAIKLRGALDGLRQQTSSLIRQQKDEIYFESYMTMSLIIAGLLLSGALAATSVTLLRREIATRSAVEIALLERQAALARSNDELEQFAHLASHDLQEPLRMISSYTQLLARRYANQLDADANDFIGYAVDGTKRMQALINGLLNFSRVATTAKPLEPVDLEGALKDALKDLEIRIEDSGASVTHDALPTVNADPVQMRQLLLNLLGNGMKFQPPKQKPVVSISAAREGPEWRFGVRDNGIGIDTKYFKNLFQIFKRLHSSTEYPGTGIGLAVCKKIVERHGGRIWVESAPGQGSTFLFTLPAMETLP